MTAEEKIRTMGCEGLVILTNPSYDSALIGVTAAGRAVYDYDKMVRWRISLGGCPLEEAEDQVNKTIEALPSLGEKAPLIMYPLPN